jgi:hypothetical protein
MSFIGSAERGQVIEVTLSIRWEDERGWAMTFVLRRRGQARVDAQWEVYDRLSRLEALDVIEAVLGVSMELG